MKKIILASLAALSLVSPLQAQAEGSGLTANVGLVTDYRFRGITQTFGKQAIQGGIDFVHSSGLYVGNWNSQVNEGAGYPGGHWETDVYAGYKKGFGDLGLDVGVIYYGYPGSNSTSTRYQLRNSKTGDTFNGSVTNTEIYVGGSWKWFAAKYFYSIGDYFSMPGTSGSSYIDLSANHELGDGWAINAHLGQLSVRGINTSTQNYNYSDLKFGATKDVAGWVVGLTAILTTAKADRCNLANYTAGTSGAYCFTDNLGPNVNYNVKNAGNSTVVLSVTKGF